MKKSVLSLLACSFLALAGCSSTPEEPSKTSSVSQQALSIIELVPESDKVLVNEPMDIEIKTDPANTALSDADFSLSGGSIQIEGSHAKFKADQTGTYTVTAEKEGIKSNPITVEVLAAADSEARPEENVSEKPAESTTAKASETQTNQTDTAKNDSSQSPAGNTATNQAPAESSPASAESSGSSAPDSQSDTSTRLPLPLDAKIVSATDVLEHPENYLNQTITVSGSLPQTAPLDANGQPQMVLYGLNASAGTGIPLTGNTTFPFGGCNAELTGVLRQNTKGLYYLDVQSAIQTSNGSAGDYPNREPGTPVSTMPKTGTFQFTVDHVYIRNGENGLSSPYSGYVYNAGMTVNYDGLYQKDGYTWLTYTSRAGIRHSVAIGDLNTVQYGFLAGM